LVLSFIQLIRSLPLPFPMMLPPEGITTSKSSTVILILGGMLIFGFQSARLFQTGFLRSISLEVPQPMTEEIAERLPGTLGPFNRESLIIKDTALGGIKRTIATRWVYRSQKEQAIFAEDYPVRSPQESVRLQRAEGWIVNEQRAVPNPTGAEAATLYRLSNAVGRRHRILFVWQDRSVACWGYAPVREYNMEVESAEAFTEESLAKIAEHFWTLVSVAQTLRQGGVR
jgi:hypothetical protein